MNLKTALLFITIFFLSLTGIALLIFRSEIKTNQKPSPQQAIKIAILEKSFSWGDIPINGGKVRHTFTITNNDPKQPLNLFDVKTSCMCTTAYLEKNGQQSPLFGMHTKSSYQMTLQPHETDQLHVTFDPAYHGPQGLGPITRFVTVKTNAINQPELTFTVTATVRN